MYLYLTRQKVKPGRDEIQLLEFVLDALQKLDIRVLGVGKKVMGLVELAHNNGFLDAAEALAQFVWTGMVEHPQSENPGATTETRITKAGAFLIRICQQRGECLLDDKLKFSHYLSGPGILELVKGIRIDDRASAMDNDPTDLLLIRGYRTPLQWAAENGHEWIVKQLLEPKQPQKI